MISMKYFQKTIWIAVVLTSKMSYAQVIDFGSIFKQAAGRNNSSEIQKDKEENKTQNPTSNREPQVYKEGSAAFVEKLSQYQAQVPLIPATSEGYRLFQKLNSEFLDLTTNREYTRAMIADEALQNLNNKVADIFIKRRPEFKNIESQVKKEQFAEGEKNRALLATKYKNEIQKLGFAQSFLESTIYLQEANQKPRKFMKFKDWVAILLDSGKYKFLQKIAVEKTNGILLKIEGEPSNGITFRKDSDELYAAYFVDSTGDASEIDEVSQGSVSLYMLKSIAD